MSRFDASGSANLIQASLLDIVGALKGAKPVPITSTREEWLQSRGKPTDAYSGSTKQHGDSTVVATGPMVQRALPQALALVPVTVPELPEVKSSFWLREALRACLLTCHLPANLLATGDDSAPRGRC